MLKDKLPLNYCYGYTIGQQVTISASLSKNWLSKKT